jgi:general secretion pathway protein C
MPNFPKFDVKRFFKRKPAGDSLESPATTRSPSARLSVNSLSKISGQISVLGQGETIRKTSFWLCFALCANFVGDLSALLFEKYLPSPPISILASRSRSAMQFTSSSSYEIISDRNLFSSKTPKHPAHGIDLEAEPILSNLPFQLVGTIIFHNPGRSLAAVQDKVDNKLYPVRMGDQIKETVQILSIEARRVIFINTAARRKEFIEIPEDTTIKITSSPLAKAPAPTGGIVQVEENRYTLTRSEVDSQLANFNVLITQARALPEMRGGQMIGFKLSQIIPNSFYQKVGLKDGDIIKGVNGEKITDAAKALELLQALKSNPSLNMTIERNGKDTEFNYDIR